ncbi:uncharacterized protein LOC122509792 [Leptopilina heterotoma]|uniref:uncharacterized protein LOC122509792 n=1 Tax=Leptopilina heterotoma TaxID=63436 RepID=UPI001CA976CB|nr:uncharacterized protein LOC122509792 [Leptopilina heterotoma]
MVVHAGSCKFAFIINGRCIKFYTMQNTENSDTALLEIVKLNPCLYDRNHQVFYTKVGLKDAWLQVKEQLNLRGYPIDDPEKRFHQLRTYFMRHYREKNCGWKYYSKMTFLIGHFKSTVDCKTKETTFTQPANSTTLSAESVMGQLQKGKSLIDPSLFLIPRAPNDANGYPNNVGNQRSFALQNNFAASNTFTVSSKSLNEISSHERGKGTDDPNNRPMKIGVASLNSPVFSNVFSSTTLGNRFTGQIVDAGNIPSTSSTRTSIPMTLIHSPSLTLLPIEMSGLENGERGSEQNNETSFSNIHTPDNPTISSEFEDWEEKYPTLEYEGLEFPDEVIELSDDDLPADDAIHQNTSAQFSNLNETSRDSGRDNSEIIRRRTIDVFRSSSEIDSNSLHEMRKYRSKNENRKRSFDVVSNASYGDTNNFHEIQEQIRNDIEIKRSRFLDGFRSANDMDSNSLPEITENGGSYDTEIQNRSLDISNLNIEEANSNLFLTEENHLTSENNENDLALVARQMLPVQNQIEINSDLSRSISSINVPRNFPVNVAKKQSPNPVNISFENGKFCRVSEIRSREKEHDSKFKKNSVNRVPPDDDFANKKKRKIESTNNAIENALVKTADELHILTSNLNDYMKMKTEFMRTQMQEKRNDKPVDSSEIIFETIGNNFKKLSLYKQERVFIKALRIIEEHTVFE